MKKILSLIIVPFMVSSCNWIQEGVQEVKQRKEATGSLCLEFFTDPTTGVQYILYSAGYGAAITPRLNPDGTLHVKEE